ncbi:hypothetical protein L198_01749 [Cryptococcus wingfieldii CBS 7118]|uniref:Uncharacterized protein n=1 Tax=Cryptococcus wingfieldii CBS 7118 TaxID=1295528 RepID=A0A1E3JYU4_9TREE|nr:hypothetical protein L198_01749 [Cryptococcus wingfieldii CBS 7118]ODO05062.1 hypothetical protein L198_01749 [Cryptococcus wingfieldii CBS 7118]
MTDLYRRLALVQGCFAKVPVLEGERNWREWEDGIYGALRQFQGLALLHTAPPPDTSTEKVTTPVSSDLSDDHKSPNTMVAAAILQCLSRSLTKSYAPIVDDTASYKTYHIYSALRGYLHLQVRDFISFLPSESDDLLDYMETLQQKHASLSQLEMYSEMMLVFQLLYALPSRHHVWRNQLWATSAFRSTISKLLSATWSLPTAGALISQSG